MRSIAFADFLIGLGILFVLEGLMFAASPAWMRRAMKSALATPDNILRIVGIGSAVVGSAADLVRPALAPASCRTAATNTLWRQRNREPPEVGFSPEMPGANACASDPFGRTVAPNSDPFGDKPT